MVYCVNSPLQLASIVCNFLYSVFVSMVRGDDIQSQGYGTQSTRTHYCSYMDAETWTDLSPGHQVHVLFSSRVQIVEVLQNDSPLYSYFRRFYGSWQLLWIVQLQHFNHNASNKLTFKHANESTNNLPVG